MALQALRAALLLACCVGPSLSFAPTALHRASPPHTHTPTAHTSPLRHAGLQLCPPAPRHAAALVPCMASSGSDSDGGANLAKERALQANREQWGITEPLKAGLSSDSDGGANLAKKNALAANKEQWGITEPLKASVPATRTAPPSAKRGTSGFSRNDLHLSRKAFHIIGGTFFALTRLLVSRSLYVAAIGMVGFLTFVFEVFRLRFPKLNDVIIGVLGKVMRDHEADQFSGMAYYATGVATTCLLFDETIAVIGILSLAIGDPAASFCGQTSGRFLGKSSWLVKKVLPGKSIAGILGFIISVAALNALVLFPTGALTVPVILSLILAPAVIGSIVEVFIPSPQLCLPYKAFPLGLDDNFLLPVFTAAAAHAVWASLGGGAPPPTLKRFLLF